MIDKITDEVIDRLIEGKTIKNTWLRNGKVEYLFFQKQINLFILVFNYQIKTACVIETKEEVERCLNELLKYGTLEWEK